MSPIKKNDRRLEVYNKRSRFFLNPRKKIDMRKSIISFILSASDYFPST